MDEAAYPWQADWYDGLVQGPSGRRGRQVPDLVRRPCDAPRPRSDRATARPVRTTRIVNYGGVLEQALRDVVAWVETDWPRRPSTDYGVVDGQVVVPARRPSARASNRPSRLAANGGQRADVTVGEPVGFAGFVEVSDRHRHGGAGGVGFRRLG